MTYLASLLRQSGTRVGDASSTLGRRPSAGIEVDAVREVARDGSASAPVAAATEPAPRALRPVRSSAASDGSPSTALRSAAGLESPVGSPRDPPPAEGLPATSAAANAATERAHSRVVVDRRAAEQPAKKPDRPTVTPRLSDHEETGVSRDEQVLQQVAEVVAWVAAGANPHQPEQPSQVVVPPADASQVTRAAASTRESAPGESRFPAQADEPDEPAPRVTVGTIEVTVEAPEPAPPTAPPPAPVQPPAAPDVSRLTRHYVRV
jgi:hypothetical protein